MDNLTNEQLVQQRVQEDLGHCAVADSAIIRTRETTCNRCEFFDKENKLCSENPYIPITTLVRIQENICPRSKW
jgi:hypothetical protein